MDQFSGSRARIPPLQLRKQRLLVPLPAWTTAGLAAGLCHSAETALATVQELRAVPVALPDGPVWPLPYVSATSAALFRALGLPDPKARFEADPALAGPRPSTPHNLRAPANPPLRTSPSKRRLPRP